MTQQATSPQRMLSETELYVVYLEVARRDHDWRIRALYGDQQRPQGHSPFRPLGESVFNERRLAACQIPQGDLRFQQQLLRRAHYYRVDVANVLSPSGQRTGCQPVAPVLSVPLGGTTPLSSGNQTV